MVRAGAHYPPCTQTEDRMPTSSTIEISDHVLWGKLVKSWATGENYVNPGQAPFPLPRNLAELHKQTTGIGLTVKLPPSNTGLAFVQYSPEVATIKLPPKAMIEATESEITQPTGAYRIPKFYDDFYGKNLVISDADERMNFHAARIGDYSIRNCT
jgi:hypothetical protein